MFLVSALSVTSILTGLSDLILNHVLGIYVEFTSLIVAVLVDAIIYIFHNGILRPLITELYGNFILTKDLFSAKEIMGLILNYCYGKMRVISICTIVLIAMWQLFKTYFAYFVQTEVEDGLKIAAKLMIFTTLAWSARDICIKFVNIGAEVVTGIVKMALQTGIGDGASNQEIIRSNIDKMFDVMENLSFSMFSTGGDAAGIFDIVKFVFILKIDMELLKLGVSMAEKYITIVFMIVISPIAFVCGVVKSTSTVLSKWISLFTSSILYNIMQSMVMSFMFYATSFMTIQKTNADLVGYISATYMVKDGYVFKYISFMWAILALGRNAVYLIDELGFSFLGESTNQIGSFAKVAATSAALGNMKVFDASKTAYGGVNKLKDKFKKTPGMSVKISNDIGIPGGPNVNYGDDSGGPNVNYGDDEDDNYYEPGVNYSED